MFAILSTLLSSPAAAWQCTSCDTSWTTGQTINLWGTNYTGRERLGGQADQQEYMRGVTEQHVQHWQFTHATWQGVRNKVEAEVGSIPGNVLLLAVYTNHDNPLTNLSDSNMAAVSIVAKNNGVFTHYLYKNSGGTWTNQTAYQDTLGGGIPCDQLVAFQDIYVGTETKSTIYVIEKQAANKFNALSSTIDFDVMAEIGRLGSTANAYQATGWWDDIPEYGWEGIDDDDSELENKCHIWEACRVGDPNGSGPSCNVFSSSCNSPNPGSWCPTRAALNSGHATLTLSDLQTAYAFRDALRDSSNSSVRKWVGYYYTYGFFVPPSPVQGDAVEAAFNAVDTIMNGSASSVVITSSIRDDVVLALKEGDDIHPILDTMINDLNGVLTAQEGKTRSQFCTSLTGSSTCGL